MSDEFQKGGEGSGKVGHKTFHPDQPKSNIVSLVDKLSNPEPFKAHLNKLQHGAVFEGKKLRSGKPIYLNADQAMAHGYTPEDYTDASNFHYGKMEEMSNQMQKLKDLGKKPPHEMEQIMKFHRLQFKTNHRLAETVSRRAIQTQAAAKIKKSVVMMGHNDAAEVDTGKFAQEHGKNLEGWHDHIQNCMNGYSYGDVPREISIDKGMLYLTKVDDGMYSGYVKTILPLPDGQMEDNAKVRIERMTIPSLCQFLLAKEYVLPGPSIAGNSPGNNNMMASEIQPEQYQDLNESLMLEPMSEAMPEAPPLVPKVESNLDKKIMMLQLIEKLLS